MKVPYIYYYPRKRLTAKPRFWAILLVITILIFCLIIRHISLDQMCTSYYWRYVFAK